MAKSSSQLGADSRRSFLRLRVGIGARFETLAGSQAVRLIDLSQGGAQIILSRPEEAGAGVLTWLTFESFAELAWQEESHIGLRFERVVAPACLAETRRRAPSVVREEESGTKLAQAWASGEISDN